MTRQISTIFLTFFVYGTTILFSQGLECENCVQLKRTFQSHTNSTPCIDYEDFVTKTHSPFSDLGYLPVKENPKVCALYTFELKRGPMTLIVIIRLGLAKSDLNQDESSLDALGSQIEVDRSEDVVNMTMTCVSASNVTIGGSRVANWVQSCECSNDLCNQADPVIPNEGQSETNISVQNSNDTIIIPNINSAQKTKFSFHLFLLVLILTVTLAK